MKIIIFENQFHQVKVQFEIANKLFFKDQLIFEQYNAAQEFQPLSKIVDYDLAIIDISLSSNSKLDGFDLISEIIKIEKRPRILILTGNSNIEEGLEKRGLPKFLILYKPVDPIDIANKIKACLNIKG
ncbi:MAG: response regulator [Bacteroidia bacterium]